MSSFPSPTAEPAEGYANLTAKITPTGEDGASKERSMPQPSLKPGLNHLKPTTSTTSEEDPSDKKSANQTAVKAATEILEKSSQSEKIEAGSDVVAGSVGAEGSAANPSDTNLDLRSEEDAESEQQDEVSREEKFSDEDSQDTHDIKNEIDKENGLTYTAEGQELYKRRAEKRIAQFEPYFRSVEYRMNFLEKALKELRGDDQKAEAKPQIVVEKTPQAISEPIEKTPPAVSEPIEKTPPTVSEIILSIRRMNWAEFKPYELSKDSQEPSQRFTFDRLKVRPNLQGEMESRPTKVSGNQPDGTPGAMIKNRHHVLEVLVEDPGASKRRRVRKQIDDGTIAKGSSQKAKACQKGDTTISQPSSVIETPILQCPERVRICSMPLLQIIGRLIDLERHYWWHMSHTVFLRPFKFFVLYEAEIRVALNNLERRWQTTGQSTPMEQTSGRRKEDQKTEAGKSNDRGSQNHDTETNDVSLNPAEKTDTLEALEHLRLLVEFLDNDLKSTFALRRQIKSKKDCPIAFSDLWHLYEHGQEVRTPGNQIQVFIVAKFTGGRDILCGYSPEDGPGHMSGEVRRESKGSFFVECYSYDFDGKKYGPVRTMFEIRRYEGFQDITSLQVYPWCFDPDHQNERYRLAGRGEKFLALAAINKTSHKKYRGISLDEHAEEIDSPIVVDLQLAITNGKMKVPSIGFQTELEHNSCECHDPLSDDLTHNDLNAFDIPLSQDPEELGEDERLLLPYSLHGFVLRNKKWRIFNIDNVEDIKFNSSGFDDLVLPPGHKDTVEALVNRHSRYIEAVGTRTEIASSMDLVTGKGNGLIILLHGAPGVGKTSTAECVAEKTKRPLFAITCGDLGESAIEIEENLEKNFSLAHRWGCLLLLDEADVFLSVRSQTDLRRNAVVSVFLRTLEYYSGILFLTTNRVGTLDPAFKSRIHVSLYYPNLTKKASSEIWRNHIKKTKDYFETKGAKYSLRKREIIEYSKQHFKDLSSQESGPWNGRQIRNAFQTAIALSEHEAYLNGGNPELTERHFEKVAKVSSEFDNYLRLTHGRSESQMAKASKIRTDNPDKVAKMKSAIASRQLPRVQPNPEDELSDSDSDSSEPFSSDASKTSSSEEVSPAKASKKMEKKQKARSTRKVKKERKRQESSSEEEASNKKKSKQEKARADSASEEESLPAKKTKKGKAKHESTSDEDSPPATKKSKQDKASRKKRKESSSDEDEQKSGEAEKEMKKAAKETKGKEKEKEKAKSTSKTFN